MKKILLPILLVVSLLISCSSGNNTDTMDDKSNSTTDYNNEQPSTNGNETNSNTNQTH